MTSSSETTGDAPAIAGADHRRRRPRGEATRRRIVDAAIELFAASGYRGTSLADLAKRAGMTHQALLYYFGSKERLLLDVVAERERQERVGYPAIAEGQPMISHLHHTAQVVSSDRRLARLYVVLAAENLDGDDALHDFFVDRYRSTRRLIALAVDRDRTAGLVRGDVDPEQIGREVLAVLMGAEAQWLMEPDDFDYLGTVDRYVDDLCARLAPPAADSGGAS
jgi:AcrR family transcriptional regulator